MARLGLLVVAAGTATTLAVWQHHHQEAIEKAEETNSKVLPSFASDRVVKLVLEGETGRFELTRPPGSPKAAWRIVRPLETLADASVVAGILQHLAQLRRTAVVGGDVGGSGAGGVDLRLFALDPPRFEVRATLDDGHDLSLCVGKRNSFDGSIYVKVPGSGPVMSVSGALEYQLDKDLFALRDKQLLRVERDEVSRVEISLANEDRTYELIRDGTGYRISKPQALAADLYQAQSVISALLEVRAQRFIQEAATQEALRSHGLTRPHVQARLRVDRPGANGVLVLLGHKEDGDEVYASLGVGHPIIEATHSGVLRAVSVTLWDLRDKHVARFDRAQVVRLVLRGNRARLAFEKRRDQATERDQWHLIAPVPKRAKDSVVETLLFRLWDLQARKVASEEPTPAMVEAAGLLDPTLVVEFYDAQDKALAAVAFGQLEEATGDLQFARQVEGRRIDLVSKKVVADISLDAASYTEAEEADSGDL